MGQGLACYLHPAISCSLSPTRRTSTRSSSLNRPRHHQNGLPAIGRKCKNTVKYTHLFTKIHLFFSETLFLRVKAGTAVARLSHRKSLCLSVTRVDQSKMVQARITSASWKTSVSISKTF